MDKFNIVWLGLVLVVGLVNSISVEEDLSLTFKQKQALDKFKDRMIPNLPHEYMKQDIFLIRWLRARNFNLDQAEQMLRANLKWRTDNNMDNIDKEDWSDMTEDFAYHTDGNDREGRPVGTLNIQGWNFRKIALTGKMPRLLKYMDKLLEEATQAVLKEQALGKNVTQWKVILNMDGFNIITHACPQCLPAYAAFVTSYEAHYPGFADGLILINTTPAFQIVLEIARPIFSIPTQRALKIYGTDQKVWKQYLLNEIDPAQLRPDFGGTKQD